MLKSIVFKIAETPYMTWVGEGSTAVPCDRSYMLALSASIHHQGDCWFQLLPYEALL